VDLGSAPTKKSPDATYLISLPLPCAIRKKAIVIADECLGNEGGGVLANGKLWDGLYVHVLAKRDVICKREAMFAGFIAFVSLTRYNKGGTNYLEALASSSSSTMIFHLPPSNHHHRLSSQGQYTVSIPYNQHKPAHSVQVFRKRRRLH